MTEPARPHRTGPPAAQAPERPVRLAILIHSLSAGGAERVAVHLANHFAAAGWQVTVLTLDTADADVYQPDPGVTRQPLGVAQASHGLAAALSGTLRRIRAVRAALKSGRFDTVLALTSYIAVLTLLSTRGLPIRVIVSERIHPPSLRIGRAWHVLRKHLYRSADAVVVLADQSRQWIETHAPGARPQLIPNPVVLPLPDTEPRLDPSRHVASGLPLLLAVGRLSPQKGFDTLIAAFGRIASALPDWQLVIIGEGDERATLQAQVERLGLSESIRLPGLAGNLADWYREADLFVLSSRFEGFPNALAEAMAHGCAAVAFDCPTGPRDLVRDGVDGVLVRNLDDAGALAAALSRLMTDTPTRIAMAAEARSVRQRYSAERIMALWASVLSPEKRGRIGVGVR